MLMPLKLKQGLFSNRSNRQAKYNIDIFSKKKALPTEFVELV